MSRPVPVVFTAALQRKDPRLPVYVVVPYAHVAQWKLEATTMVEGTIHGQAFGRRSMKRMNATSHSDWFVEFTAPICKALGVRVGDELKLSLRLAATEIPQELQALLAQDPSMQASWNSLSEYTRRTTMEHIRAGKTEVTRLRRALAIASQLKPGEGNHRPRGRGVIPSSPA